MRIRLKYPDVETFVEKYAPNISEGGMFIQSRAPQPVGTLLRFELMLQDGTPLLKGEGHVIWVKEYDAAHPTRVHGMGVRFEALDAASQLMIARVVASKEEEPLLQGSQTQEVRALVNQAATSEEEPDSDLAEPPPARGGALFASLLEEAREAPAPAPAAVEIQPPPAKPVPPRPLPIEAAAPAAPEHPPLASEPRADEAGGNGVTVALEMAEVMLRELLQQSGLDDARVDATLREVLSRPGVPGDAELEALLAPTPLPPVELEEALQALRKLDGPTPITAAALAPAASMPSPVAPGAQQASVPVAARALAAELPATITRLETPAPVPAWPPAQAAMPQLEPPAAPPPPLASLETPLHGLEVEEPFDPTLLEAAARTARAAKQRSERAFDLSDHSSTGEPAFEAPATEEVSNEEMSRTAKPDPGWTNLQTVTELLDHGSSRVLQDMAQYARESEEEPGGVASPRTAREPEEAPTTHEPEEAGTQPFLSPRESAEALSREMWREVVSEAAEDLSAGGLIPERPAGTRGPGDREEPSLSDAHVDEESFFDGMIPDEEVVEEPADLDAELSLADAEYRGEPIMPEPEAEQVSAEDAALAARVSSEIFSDLDPSPIGDFDDVEPGEESTQITAAPAFEEGGRGRLDPPGHAALRGRPGRAEVSRGGGGRRAEAPGEGELALHRGSAGRGHGEFALHRGASDGGEQGKLRRSHPGAAGGREDPQFFDEPLEPGRREGSDPEELATEEPPVHLSPEDDLSPDDLRGLEPDDALPPDPDLENEVFEALAGLRDTLREPRAAEKRPRPEREAADEQVPDLADLALQPETSAAGREALAPDVALDTDVDERAPDELEGDGEAEGRKLKPRRSGILRRIFGKKE